MANFSKLFLSNIFKKSYQLNGNFDFCKKLKLIFFSLPYLILKILFMERKR